MSQQQLQVICHRLGFHPGVAGMLYYSLQATSGTAAVFALGLAVFSLQVLAGGIALVMSFIGAFGSTLLLGGAAGTAVVGGSVVVPAFVLSAGSSVLVFIAGVVTRDTRRLHRGGSRRSQRQLPPRIYELPEDDQREIRNDGDREAGSSGSQSRRRERVSGARDAREHRRESRKEAKESNSSSSSNTARTVTFSSGTARTVATDAARGAPIVADAARQESRAATGASAKSETRAAATSAASTSDNSALALPLQPASAASEDSSRANACDRGVDNESNPTESAITPLSSPVFPPPPFLTAAPAPEEDAPVPAMAVRMRSGAVRRGAAPSLQRAAPLPPPPRAEVEYLSRPAPTTPPQYRPLPPIPPATPPHLESSRSLPDNTAHTTIPTNALETPTFREEGVGGMGGGGQSGLSASGGSSRGARQGGGERWSGTNTRALTARDLQSSLSQQSRDALCEGKAFLL